MPMSHVFVVVCADGSLLVCVGCCSCQRRGGLGSVFCSSSAAHPNVAATHRPARPFSDNMVLAVYTALVHLSGVCERCSALACTAVDWGGMLQRHSDAQQTRSKTCHPKLPMHTQVRQPQAKTGYLDVGITNSAPLPMLSGQRCMMLFCFV